MASCGDSIHLDGYNTDRDPYTCQTGTSNNSLMHITKNLGFVASGRTRPHIQCLPNNGFFFDGSGNNQCKMNVTISRILFNETSIVFLDSSANIDRCKFEGNQTTMVFIATKQLSPLWEIQIASSTFLTDALVFWTAVVNISQAHPLRDVQKEFNLRDVLSVISVLQNQSCIALSSDTLPVVNCNISLTDVTISTKSSNSVTLFCFGLGQQNLRLQKVQLVKNSSPLMEESCEVIVHSQQTVNVIVNESRFESTHSRALNVLAGNISLHLHNSTFTGHAVEGDGGAISLKGKQSCKVKVFKSSFKDTTSTLHGGAISIECGSNNPNSRNGFTCAKVMNLVNGEPSVIHITNTEFRHCSARQGGAIFLRHSGGNMSILVKKSNFTDNHLLGGLAGHLRGYGGAIGLLLAHNDAQSECAKGNTSFEQVNSYLSGHRISHLSVEDTKFEGNAGEFGGAIYLINGNATFRNCYFIDNFASADGGHIYAYGGFTSLEIQQSFFNQTIKHLELQKSTKNFAETSFIHVESVGQLKLSNTTLDSRPHSSKTTLIAIYGGRCIDFGNDSSTVFYCPHGSQMKIPFNITNNHTGVTLRYDCVACSLHMYSLQRGTAFGEILNEDFECLQCPFGADCTRNFTRAKTNFWGFQMQDNPPALNFTMCPLGYCRPPEKTNSPSEYNGCNGNRSGELCGKCNDAYTEALYSTNCRPSHECNDVWFWFVALAYVSVMALYLTYKPLVLPCIYRQIFWFKEHQAEDKENNADSGYLKIVFYFYQAADLLLISRSSTSVIKTHLIEPIMGIFNFQQKAFYGGSPCPFAGLTVVYKKLFSSIHVFGTLGMICLMYALHVGVKRIQGDIPPSLDPYLGGILRTMLLGYSRLGSISFDLLRCVPIGSGRRLFYDGNIVCFQWWQYILVAVICTFLVPFVFVLFWGSFKLQSGTISVTHFLLACSLPLPFLLHWVFLSLFCKQRNAASKDLSPNQVSTSSVERVLYDCFKRSEESKRFSFSWESVMIGRRLILIVLKAFISDPMPRLLIMSFFCVLFLLQHALIQPFRDDIANTVETIYLLCVVVLAIENVFFASFLSLAVPITDDHFNFWWKIYQGIEIVLICSFPAVLGLLLIAVILSQMCRLTVLVCRFVYNSCLDLCGRPPQYSRLQDHVDRTKPLLAPFS